MPRHEFIHVLVESRARAGTPLWFREGLVLYLSEPAQISPPVMMSDQRIEAAMNHANDQESLQRAYAAARTRIAQLVQQNGRESVLHWLSIGLPDSLSSPASQH